MADRGAGNAISMADAALSVPERLWLLRVSLASSIDAPREQREEKEVV